MLLIINRIASKYKLFAININLCYNIPRKLWFYPFFTNISQNNFREENLK